MWNVAQVVELTEETEARSVARSRAPHGELWLHLHLNL